MPGKCTLQVERVRARMADLDTTQAELANACGVEVRTVQRWFAGQRVSLENAERVARALGVGTAESFTGVSEEHGAPISSRVRLIQRLLSGRDSAFAQGFRLLREHFDMVLHAISFEAHPAYGYVARLPVDTASRHGFAVCRLHCEAQHAEIGVRCQVGRRFSYLTAGVLLRGGSAHLVEVFQARSMGAARAQDGSVELWFWVGAERSELVFVSNREVTVTMAASGGKPLLELDQDVSRNILCLRPNTIHLRSAGLPMGDDRVRGPRQGRLEVPVDWHPVPFETPQSG